MLDPRELADRHRRSRASRAGRGELERGGAARPPRPRAGRFHQPRAARARRTDRADSSSIPRSSSSTLASAGSRFGTRPPSATWRCCATTRTARRRKSTASCSFPALTHRVLGDGERGPAGVAFVRNRARARRSGRLRAVATGETRGDRVGLVLRSIGYRGRPARRGPLRRAPRTDPQRRRTGLDEDGAHHGRVRRRLDQARPHRRDRHQQEGRRGHGRAVPRTSPPGALRPARARPRRDRSGCARASPTRHLGGWVEIDATSARSASPTAARA